MFKKFILVLFVSSFGFSQQTLVDSISFSNTKKMDVDFLYKIITTKSNLAVDSLQIEKDITFLKRLNGISNVTYTITYIENQKCNINFDIQENKSVIPNIAIWSTKRTTAIMVGLFDYNFQGKNTSIGGYYQYNYFHSFGLSYSAPYLFTNKLGLETHTQQRSSLEPVFFNNTSADYKYTNSSVEILGVYQLNFNNRFKLGYSIFNEKYQYESGATKSNIPLQLDIYKMLYKLEYSFQNVVYDYYLLDGLKNDLFLQCVTPTKGGQEQFYIGWNDFMYYNKIGKNSNWATRLRIGLSTNKNTPFAPFAVDNNINIRGVGNLIDRGTGAIILNTEFRKTLYEKNWFVLQGNIFVDSGTWRSPGGSFSDFHDKNIIRIHPGLGLRFIHKTFYNAIFRIDYGYGITPNSSRGIVFGVGQYF